MNADAITRMVIENRVVVWSCMVVVVICEVVVYKYLAVAMKSKGGV
jgi:hypothetical protein